MFVSFSFKALESFSKKLSNIYTKKYKNNQNNLLIDARLKLKFFKEQEDKGSLSALRAIKLPILSDLPMTNIFF